MTREPLFPTAAQPRGTMAQVKAYWAEYPSRFASQWRRAFPGQRQTPASEIFPHLPSAPGTVEGTRLPTPGRVPAHQARPGTFFDPTQKARAGVSPLGGKIW
jgi:hypothetical protein